MSKPQSQFLAGVLASTNYRIVEDSLGEALSEGPTALHQSVFQTAFGMLVCDCNTAGIRFLYLYFKYKSFCVK